MISEDMIKDLREKEQKHFSLSRLKIEDDPDNGTYEDLLIEENTIDPTQAISLRETREKRLDTFPVREVNIIKYLFGIDEFVAHSLEDTANKFGYKWRQSVAFKKKRFIKKIKEMKNIDELKSYL